MELKQDKLTKKNKIAGETGLEIRRRSRGSRNAYNEDEKKSRKRRQDKD